ncbi:MAG TPA: polysaccharide deacetylase family protein, partial [Bacteroidales bacterium]|nr:polysaccharide deacetylase family protein [Bacteroidales bacterium]
AVLRGKANDPFDTFHLQLSLQQQYKLRPVYFILFAAYGHNDKNISVRNRHFQQLIKYLGDYADIGIHPSYASYSNKQLLKHELNQLSAILNREVSCSRQHFLRMSLPETYQNLIEHDILNDYTMGYAAMPGFRAGIADDFYFYDLDHEVKTALRIHPFAVMDGTLRDYMQLDAEEAVSKAEDLINSVKAVNGKFILLWHNETLSDQKRWTGWRKVYQNLVESALP